MRRKERINIPREEEAHMIELPLERAFMLIEPGPVVLVSTAHKGKANVMTMTWHMVVDFTPRIACIIGPWDYTFRALKATKECVIAIPTVDMAGTVIDIGSCSGADVDKFRKFRLTPLQAGEVQAPLIKECLANIECRVVDTKLVNAYGLHVLEGVKAWVDNKRRERRTFHANGDGTFVVDGRTLDLKERMLKKPDWL